VDTRVGERRFDRRSPGRISPRRGWDWTQDRLTAPATWRPPRSWSRTSST